MTWDSRHWITELLIHRTFSFDWWIQLCSSQGLVVKVVLHGVYWNHICCGCVSLSHPSYEINNCVIKLISGVVFIDWKRSCIGECEKCHLNIVINISPGKNIEFLILNLITTANTNIVYRNSASPLRFKRLFAITRHHQRHRKRTDDCCCYCCCSIITHAEYSRVSIAVICVCVCVCARVCVWLCLSISLSVCLFVCTIKPKRLKLESQKLAQG